MKTVTGILQVLRKDGVTQHFEGNLNDLNGVAENAEEIVKQFKLH